MSLRIFFRPSIEVVMLAAGITIAAAALTYAEIVCALNGSSSCFALPAAIDIILIAILWPLILAFRLLMSTGTIVVNTVGIFVSFIWVYFLLCVVRWGMMIMKNRRKKTDM